MKIVGLTGGIGSGKSTVSEIFKNKGIAVYNSDSSAKILMNSHPKLKQEILNAFGNDSYKDGVLNTPFLASVVFSDSNKLSGLNELVHPYVRTDFFEWVSKQSSQYVIQEAAILFETGSYKHFDRMILVTAPQEVRIQRVVDRDAITPSAVLDRIQKQWADDKKIELADFIIQNIDIEDTKTQVEAIHRLLLEEFQ